MNFIFAEVDTYASNRIEVSISRQANVILLDRQNFNNYKNGKKFNYIGGNYKSSPIILIPPHPGHWFVVIDLGGYSGTLKYSVRVI